MSMNWLTFQFELKLSKRDDGKLNEEYWQTQIKNNRILLKIKIKNKIQKKNMKWKWLSTLNTKHIDCNSVVILAASVEQININLSFLDLLILD